MSEKWNEKAGKSLHVFNGNFLTGRVVYGGEFKNDSGIIEKAIDDGLQKLLSSGDLPERGFVWATMDARNSVDACLSEFKRFMEFRKRKYVEDRT